MGQFKHLARYLAELQRDIYPQPQDEKFFDDEGRPVGHQHAIDQVGSEFLADLSPFCNILDMGCGQGQAFEMLGRYTAGVVTGATLGGDYRICRKKGLNVYQQDMTFTGWLDNSFDLIFSRHVLEHSPMPLITLMEWQRIGSEYLCLILPKLDHFGAGGLNHYYVLTDEQWRVLLDRAGWDVIKEDHESTMVPELRYLCKIKTVVSDGDRGD